MFTLKRKQREERSLHLPAVEPKKRPLPVVGPKKKLRRLVGTRRKHQPVVQARNAVRNIARIKEHDDIMALNIGSPIHLSIRNLIIWS